MTNYTEKQIMIETINLIQEFGYLTTSELITELHIKMKPTEHDIEIIEKRKDDYFSQKARNLISHRESKNNIFLYVDSEKKDGVTLLKSRGFNKLIDGLNSTEINDVIEKRKQRAKKFIAKQLNFQEINFENKLLGDEGEKYVLAHEINIAKNFEEDLSKLIQHTSKELGDGAGYDILSVNEQKELRFLEVKTTKGKYDNSFFMSLNEYAFYLENKESYELVRVFNFDMTTKTGEIKYIKGIELESSFEFIANQYRVVLK
ncbi:MAG: DUF3883 domain-containing protein [Anaerorhabdus sp.]|uniref:DUF3883 domain-containing protein n=1 Tax=Anaerorhabdus sp. TaxID=1872524 RepID=UPI003A840FD2